MNKISEALGGIHAVVALAQIDDSSRGRLVYGNMADLELSLREHGQLQNLVLRQNEDGEAKPFKLLAGGRRFRAMSNMGWEEANCLIFARDLDELELLEIEYEENVRRKDLEWKEDHSRSIRRFPVWSFHT